MAFRTNKMPVLQEKSASGAVATFNTALAMPLASCNIAVNAWQEGSGTPSPDNVRPLHAFSSANIINVSDYGSWFRGIYQGVYGFVDLGSLNWNYQATYHYMYARLNGGKYTNSSVGLNGLCSLYEVDATNSYSSLPDKCMIVGSNFIMINVCSVVVNDSSYTDANAFKTAMSGVYLIYELATPTTPTITPEQFETLCQAFGITGNTYTFTFGQDIYQGYIDWKKGVVVGTWSGKVDMGLLNWGYNSSFQAFYISLPNMYIPTTGQERLQGIANEVYPISTVDAISLMNDKSCLRYNGYLWTKDSDYTDRGDFKNSLIGKYVAYELATPQTIQLTPQEIETIIGNNNIFADTGDIDLTYKDLDIAKRGNFREVFKVISA